MIYLYNLHTDRSQLLYIDELVNKRGFEYHRIMKALELVELGYGNGGEAEGMFDTEMNYGNANNFSSAMKSKIEERLLSIAYDGATNIGWYLIRWAEDIRGKRWKEAEPYIAQDMWAEDYEAWMHDEFGIDVDLRVHLDKKY